MTEPIRVLLADDHKVLREGMKMLLSDEPDIEVVAEAGTGKEAVEKAGVYKPDIVVMDLGMPGMSGLEAISIIKHQHPQIGIVVLSMHSGRDMVVQAIEAGSDGYVPKSSAHNNLLQAIRTVHSGQRFLDPAAATAVVDELMHKSEEARMLTPLSEREIEVLRWTALGFTSREIGDKLALSPKTVETYRQRGMEKLNLEHKSDLIRFALKAGLLDTKDA